MKVTFRAPIHYSPSRIERHVRYMLNNTNLTLPVEEAIAVYYYCLGLESMALGIYWDAEDGTVDMEIPVADPELKRVYFDVPDKNSSAEPDGISAILDFCVRQVSVDRILRYLDTD